MGVRTQMALVLAVMLSLGLNLALAWALALSRAKHAWLDQQREQPRSLCARLLLQLGQAEHGEAATLTFERITD